MVKTKGKNGGKTIYSFLTITLCPTISEYSTISENHHDSEPIDRLRTMCTTLHFIDKMVQRKPLKPGIQGGLKPS
jgi:hypothetical protein